MKSTAESQHARTSNERNKVALQEKVQLERNMPKVSEYQYRALLESALLETAVVKSVHACRRIFPSVSFVSFFSFCSTFKRFVCVYSTTPTPSSPGFMRMNWAHLLSVFFLFVFHQFSSKKKRVCCHFIDDVRVRVCAEACLKDSFFFLRLNL